MTQNQQQRMAKQMVKKIQTSRAHNEKILQATKVQVNDSLLLRTTLTRAYRGSLGSKPVLFLFKSVFLLSDLNAPMAINTKTQPKGTSNA